MQIWVCSSAGRAAVSKAAGRGFESLRTRIVNWCFCAVFSLIKDKVSSVGINSRTMDLKKEQRDPVIREGGAPQKVAKRHYIEDIKTELKQVTWTSKEELFAYTKIVVGATFLLGLGVYLVDLGIQLTLDMLTWLTRITIG